VEVVNLLLSAQQETKDNQPIKNEPKKRKPIRKDDTTNKKKEME
jgi:hypothetical protein